MKRPTNNLRSLSLGEYNRTVNSFSLIEVEKVEKTRILELVKLLHYQSRLKKT
jgi:hypothetical protein